MSNQPTIDERRGCTSASNAQADSLCPGRHLAQRGIPEEPKSADAAFGTAIHDALAGAVNLQVGLTLDQREVFDACREIEKRLCQQYFGGEPDNTNRVFREQRYWAKVPPQMFEHSAKPDVIFRRGSKALICEYKTLRGDVPESPMNLQLRDQAVIAWRTLLLEEVAVAVVQPMVTHKSELCLYKQADLERAEQEMWNRIRASNNPASPRVPGEAQCKYCRARKVCAEYARFASSVVPMAPTLVGVPVENWTPEQCALFLEGKAIAEAWLDQCQSAIKARLKANPDSIPGWALKEGAKREQITAPQEVHERFLAIGGKTEDFLATITVAKIKLKEQVHAITNEKGKALDATVGKLIEGLTEVTQNAPSIVRVKTD